MRAGTASLRRIVSVTCAAGALHHHGSNIRLVATGTQDMTNAKVSLSGAISIMRRSSGEVVVQIRDDASRSTFVEALLSPHDFAMALTGLSETPCQMRVQNLRNVGLTKHVQSRSIVCPFNSHSREELQAWLEANCQEAGWTLDASLHSQGSVTRSDDSVVLNYRVFRYNDPSADGESGLPVDLLPSSGLANALKETLPAATVSRSS